VTPFVSAPAGISLYPSLHFRFPILTTGDDYGSQKDRKPLFLFALNTQHDAMYIWIIYDKFAILLRPPWSRPACPSAPTQDIGKARPESADRQRSKRLQFSISAACHFQSGDNWEKEQRNHESNRSLHRGDYADARRPDGG
jgi:hypothetical protein